MSTSSKAKRPKISELPSYKAPRMRQLKVTAFFGRGSTSIKDGNGNVTPAIESAKPSNQLMFTNGKLDTTLEVPEITICDSDEDDETDECQEVFCSESLIEKRKKLEQDRNRKKYDPADFVEFETFNYNDETIIDKNSSKERRRCPFYKRIPYTNICVDAFNFAKESDLKHYVLTHFHADHYVGLTKGFDRSIHCSPITARLIRYKFKVAGKYIHEHKLNEAFYINNVRCTFYDANHCPGAVIVLFELPNFMRYLHTGDFRASPQMEEIHDISCAPIDCCFLDTTFCDTSKTFPAQSEVLANTVSVCRYALERNPRTLIVCGSYCIGKERVFMAVAEALNLKVWTSKAKRALFACIDDPKLNSILVDSQEEAKIHVLPLKCLWKRGMHEYLQKQYKHFDAIVALRPSGWEYKRNKHMVPEVEGNIAIYPVPYSEHSSYTDLERFILWLRPRRIIPTVNMGDPIKRGQMNNIFRRWQRTPRYVQTSKAVVGKSQVEADDLKTVEESNQLAIKYESKSLIINQKLETIKSDPEKKPKDVKVIKDN